MLQEEVDEEMVCQHCEEACWLKEDPCAMAEMKKRMEGEATVERDSLEAFFLRLLLLDNIKQEAQEEAKSTGPKESETEEQSVVVAQNGHFKPRQPRPATPLEEEIAESVCCRCGGTVYRAELRQCRGRSYHSTCFSCFSCHRTLDAMRVSDGPDGEAYCTNCYRQRFEADNRRPVGAGSTTSILARRGDNDCCPRCGGRVFQAEKVLSAKGVYHRACFRCAEVDCGRSLDSSSYCNTPQGLVLCKTCYARLHGPQVRNFCDSFLFLHIFQGFGYSNTLVSDESRPNTPAGPRQTSSLSCSSTAR